jgi:hypothetical protein
MQFNEGTDAIIADIDFLCDTNDTSYPISAKTRNVNRWAWKAIVAQINASHRGQIVDTNLTTLPFYTTTLTGGQDDYILPSGFLRIERVEVKNSNGDYVKLLPIDQADIGGAYTEHEETDGMPKYFDLVGSSIILKPTPATVDTTASEGLRVHILPGIDIFTTGDTSQAPGFPEPFHRIVVFGACYDYLLGRQDMNKAQAYRNEAETLLKELSGFTAQTNAAEHIGIRPAHRTQSYL